MSFWDKGVNWDSGNAQTVSASSKLVSYSYIARRCQVKGVRVL